MTSGLRIPPQQSDYYGATNPQYAITGRTMRQVFPYRSPSELWGNRPGFSNSPASDGVDAGQWSEDEIAEAIFDWWISGKPYKQWYAEKYLQQQINFDFNDETTIGEENNGMEQG